MARGERRQARQRAAVAATAVGTTAAIAAIGLVSPSTAQAASHTVVDEVGEIIVGPEISDVASATVVYSPKRLRIRVTHVQWQAVLRNQKAATGGRVTFPGGRSFVIMPNVNGRRSLLYRAKDLRRIDTARPLPCTGWRHRIDKGVLRTQVSVPTRCFGFAKAPTRVKVLPFHVLKPIQQGTQPVIDPMDSTPWIRRG